MCFGAVIAKYLLFITNLIFVLAGIVIIALGAVVWNILRELQDILLVTLLPIAIIVLGCIIFFIGFLACCGAIKESRCMLITYGCIMIVLAAFKIYLAVVVFNFLSNIQNTVTGWITSAFENMDLRDVFYSLQYLFECCGTIGPSSYEDGTLPLTCCPAVSVNATCEAPDAYGGCSDIVVGWFETFGEAIGGVLTAVIVFEVVSITFAFVVSNSISNKLRR